jgi:transketolase
VSLALEARDLLAKDGVSAAVVSLPCWELFAAQGVAYRAQVLGRAPRLAVEAAVGQGWDRWTGERGDFLGMTGFGASAPASKLFEHFSITPAHVAAAGRRLLSAHEA